MFEWLCEKGRFLVAKIEKELKNYSKTEKERVVKIFTKPKFLKIIKNEPFLSEAFRPSEESGRTL